MIKIENFEDARTAVDELFAGLKAVREFLDTADGAIAAVNRLKGRVGMRLPPPKPRPAISDSFEGVVMPESMSDRVIYVLKAAGKALKPTEILDHYADLGWERPEERRAFYTAISGTLAYLSKRKKVVEKVPEGYRLKAV